MDLKQKRFLRRILKGMSTKTKDGLLSMQKGSVEEFSLKKDIIVVWKVPKDKPHLFPHIETPPDGPLFCITEKIRGGLTKQKNIYSNRIVISEEDMMDEINKINLDIRKKLKRIKENDINLHPSIGKT